MQQEHRGGQQERQQPFLFGRFGWLGLASRSVLWFRNWLEKVKNEANFDNLLEGKNKGIRD